MNIREAVDASVIHIQWITDNISIEPHRLSQDTINNLIAMGYQFIVRGPIEYLVRAMRAVFIPCFLHYLT